MTKVVSKTDAKPRLAGADHPLNSALGGDVLKQKLASTKDVSLIRELFSPLSSDQTIAMSNGTGKKVMIHHQAWYDLCRVYAYLEYLKYSLPARADFEELLSKQKTAVKESVLDGYDTIQKVRDNFWTKLIKRQPLTGDIGRPIALAYQYEKEKTVPKAKTVGERSAAYRNYLVALSSSKQILERRTIKEGTKPKWAQGQNDVKLHLQSLNVDNVMLYDIETARVAISNKRGQYNTIQFTPASGDSVTCVTEIVAQMSQVYKDTIEEFFLERRGDCTQSASIKMLKALGARASETGLKGMAELLRQFGKRFYTELAKTRPETTDKDGNKVITLFYDAPQDTLEVPPKGADYTFVHQHVANTPYWVLKNYSTYPLLKRDLHIPAGIAITAIKLQYKKKGDDEWSYDIPMKLIYSGANRRAARLSLPRAADHAAINWADCSDSDDGADATTSSRRSRSMERTPSKPKGDKSRPRKSPKDSTKASASAENPGFATACTRDLTDYWTNQKCPKGEANKLRTAMSEFLSRTGEERPNWISKTEWDTPAVVTELTGLFNPPLDKGHEMEQFTVYLLKAGPDGK